MGARAEARGASVLGSEGSPPSHCGTSGGTPIVNVAATPLVAAAYQQIRARGKGLELVFVSLDRSAAEFEATRANMPWPSLPYGGTRPSLLAECFGVQTCAFPMYFRSV